MVGQVLGNWGALVGERPFGEVEILEGKRPFLHRPCPARLAQTLSAKWFGNGSGFAVCGAGWSGKVLGVASGPVGKVRLCSTRVMEGERPFSIKLSGSSPRRFQQSQSVATQCFNVIPQKSPETLAAHKGMVCLDGDVLK